MRRAQAVALAALVAVLVGASTSSAEPTSELSWPDGSFPERYQFWVDNSYESSPSIALTLRGTTGWCDHPGIPIDAIDGCFDPATDTIGLNLKERAPHRWQLFHEVGHATDKYALTDADRFAFRAITRDYRAWDQSSRDGWFDYNPPLERFADAYALCSTKRRLSWRDLDRGRWTPEYDAQSQYGYAPTPRQHRKVCALIRTAVRRYNGPD